MKWGRLIREALKQNLGPEETLLVVLGAAKIISELEAERGRQAA